MKLKTLLVIILLMTGYMFGQSSPYPLVTLHDINFVPDSTTGWPNSPLAGDTVRVQGQVLCRPLIDPISDRRAIMYFGSALGTYIQDSSGSPWSGLNIYQADSTAYLTQFDVCDTGHTYEFTGIVSPYGQATELILVTAPIQYPVIQVDTLTIAPRHKPILLTLDSCFNSDGSFNVKLRKYLGMYVMFAPDATHPNIITSNLITGSGSTAGGFKVDNGNGQMIQVYTQSKYFKTGTSYALRTPAQYTPPVNGAYLGWIKGLLEAYTNTWEVVPLYPNDLGPILQSPPAILNVKRDIPVVTSNDAVNITCSIKAVTAGTYVKGASLFVRLNGQTLDSLDMTKVTPLTADSLWTVTIPQIVIDSAYVEYYIKAYGSNDLNTTSPQNIKTSRYSYFILNRPLTIQDVRYSPLGSGYSGYNGYPVTISGIVTADTSSIPGSGANNPPRVFIQNGSTPWSGIILGYKGTFGMNVFDLRKGDLVTVTGTPVLASTTGTRLDTLTALTVVSHNNPLPPAHVMSTGIVGYSALGTVPVEEWNSCLVTYNNVMIDSANADGAYNYGESYGKDTSVGNHTRITWSDGRTRFFAGPTAVTVHKGDKFGSITGILGYTHTNYKLVPRNDNDITGYVINDVKSNNYAIPTAYKLNQNFPNPFNPSTIISYDIPKSGIVNLKIFNVLGQLVRTLVNQPQTAGTHQITFNANSLNSGVYFYSLTVDNFTQVKKMMLIK